MHDTHESITFTADDGTRLMGTLHRPRPRRTARVRVVINSELGLGQGIYQDFASWLAHEADALVLTWDYRDMEASRRRGVRHSAARAVDWGKLDYPAAVEALDTEDELLPLVAMGHGLGGVLMALSPVTLRLRGVVFVAAPRDTWGLWTAPERWVRSALKRSLIPPVSRALGYTPRQLGLGVDLPPQAGTTLARWGAHPDHLLGDPEHGRDAREVFRALTVPRMAYSFTDDQDASEEALEALLAHMPTDRLYRRRIEPLVLGLRSLGHSGLFGVAAKSPLWDEIVEFLEDEVIPAVPSDIQEP
ncbi:MAG: hypothetical protein AAFX99_02125 [Myxococcota bacterium]